MPNDRKHNPLSVRCPVCTAKVREKCWHDGWQLEVPHVERYTLAYQQVPAAILAPKTKPMSIRCPHCKAMPLRSCVGPPPFRDPKPTHKARYLAAEKIDKAILKARGAKPKVSLIDKPPEERPWLTKSGHPKTAPPVEPENRLELAKQAQARELARRARERDLRRQRDG